MHLQWEIGPCTHLLTRLHVEGTGKDMALVLQV